MPVDPRPYYLAVLRAGGDHNPAGTHRPLLTLPSTRSWIGPQRLHLPWSYGPSLPRYIEEMGRSDVGRARQAIRDNLCLVCGLPRRPGEPDAYALLSGTTPITVEHIRAGLSLNHFPTYGHLPCLWMTVRACPHLRRQATPVQVDGVQLTLEEFRTLLRRVQIDKRGSGA